jgi:hypothetical protein
MTSKPLSVADVERLLLEQKSRLEPLVAKRKELQDQLDDLDRQMYEVASFGGPRRRRGPPRLVNTAPLRTYVLNVLKKHKKGLLLADVTEKVLAAGYQSQAQMFQNVVYQCLYHFHEIEQDPNTGRYFAKSQPKG